MRTFRLTGPCTLENYPNRKVVVRTEKLAATICTFTELQQKVELTFDEVEHVIDLKVDQFVILDDGAIKIVRVS